MTPGLGWTEDGRWTVNPFPELGSPGGTVGSGLERRNAGRDMLSLTCSWDIWVEISRKSIDVNLDSRPAGLETQILETAE